ncbi:MAG: glycosyltransferase family 4 protein [Anaerolineae bacterium]
MKRDVVKSDLQPLMVSTSDIRGGAARATFRLHQGLRALGVGSYLLAFRRLSGDSAVVRVPGKLALQRVKFSTWADRYPLSLYPRRDKHHHWSVNLTPNGIAEQINYLNPSLVHLHWVGDGFVPIGALKHINVPILWTLHDMWTFTGGCHYTGGCEGYQTRCGHCPQLKSNMTFDLSRVIMRSKEKHWRGLNLTVITPSRWLAECVKASSLLHQARVEVIPNGLDLEKYKPLDKATARHMLGLPQDKHLILFGALQSLTDTRKGAHHLHRALAQLAQTHHESTEVVIFGAPKPPHPPDFGLKAHYLGTLYDDLSLAMMYAAADVFVAPSVQDNLPNTVMEALACGTVCVAFNIGGMPDMISHCENGYLATPFEADDLAQGVRWLLEDDARRAHMGQRARRDVEARFELGVIARRHVDLYQEVLHS